MCVPSYAHRRATPVAFHHGTTTTKDLLLAAPPLKFGGDSLTSLWYPSEQQQLTPKHRRVEKHQQIIVQHDYHDRSNDVSTEETTNATTTTTTTTTRGGVAMSFPPRLHEILQGVQEDGLEYIVSWQPHGRCFLVHDPKGFVEIVLPKHFKQSKLSSFQRQLNLYGFQRLTKGNDKGGYYHEYFLRGRVDLCSKIHRVKVKGTGVRARSNPDAEPDLWKMSWITNDGKPQQQQQQQVGAYSQSPENVLSKAPATSMMSLENDDVSFFEGKAFHAVTSEQRQTMVAKVAAMAEDFLLDDDYKLEQDDDTDSLQVGDFDLPSNFHLDIISCCMEDDLAFGDLLERLIDEP